MKQLDGSVYAFEPLTANYEAMAHSVKENKCTNVSLHTLGLGEKKEKLALAMTEEGTTGNAVILNQALIDERGFRVSEYINIDTLDDFYANQSVKACDFIKIDIEGAEILFLRGAKKNHHKIPTNYLWGV